jgi:hypothetical protein
MFIIFYRPLLRVDEAFSHQEEDTCSLHAGQNQASLDFGPMKGAAEIAKAKSEKHSYIMLNCGFSGYSMPERGLGARSPQGLWHHPSPQNRGTK